MQAGMDFTLTPVEARVLGVLIEKEATTPDYYPLSLGAVVNGCNQKSSREPVMAMGETEAIDALDGLISKHLAREKTPSGSRVTKYVHRLSNSLGLTHDLSSQGLGVLCVLMLRGGQTAGEIRARTGRLCTFTSVAEVEEVLERLLEDERGPYVTRLARQPGRKEVRYAHLLCGEVSGAEGPGTVAAMAEMPSEAGRISALEQEVATLREELEEVKKLLLE